MKTIIIATDFSESAINATKYAADLAEVIDADLLLMHVYQLPVSFGEVPIPIYGEDLESGASKKLDEIKVELETSTSNNLKVNTLVKAGLFFNELRTVCEEIKPYAIVMGSQGTTAAERFWFGGHTVYAMKHLMWPLLTIPPTANFSAIKKIGLACDFDKIEKTVPVNEIKNIVEDFNAELHVLNIGKKENFNAAIVFESAVLRDLFAPVKINYHFLSDDDTSDNIIGFTQNHQLDLLVVLPKHHSLLDLIFHKSYSKDMVLHSQVPVLTMHR
ncbi:MAG: universal stress protein [Ferruginibacter sp.]